MGLVIRGGLKMRPTKAQNIVELAYEFAEKQIARPTLSEKVYSRYFPYIATLFLFILVSNLVSFIPLPVEPHELDRADPGPRRSTPRRPTSTSRWR